MKNKRHYRDFPPTEEDKKTRMWFLPTLGLEQDELKASEGTIKVNIQTEEIYESRVYASQIFPNFSFKLFAKRIINGTELEVFVKIDSHFDCVVSKFGKKMTVEQYRQEVKKIEHEMEGILDIPNVIVCDLEYYKKQMQPYIEKAKEMETQK